MSTGILSIEPIVFHGGEDDRPIPNPWEGWSEEKISAEMKRIEEEAFKRNQPDNIAMLRAKIFAIVKTYIEMKLDDSDVVEYVSERFNLDLEQAELEVRIAKSFYGIFIDGPVQ